LRTAGRRHDRQRAARRRRRPPRHPGRRPQEQGRRAEPIALRFETDCARLAGHFPELEDQLCALTWSGYQGPGSPDRADAMVWAMTELFEKARGAPSVRGL
jgi:phage terminase large subunit-like protein